MTPANHKSGSHARCSKAVPTYALRIIAADIVLLRATRSQLIPPPATSDFVVSFASGGRHEVKRQSTGPRAIIAEEVSPDLSTTCRGSASRRSPSAQANGKRGIARSIARDLDGTSGDKTPPPRFSRGLRHVALPLIYAQWQARRALRSPVVENALNEFKELKAVYNSLMG